MIDKIHDTIEDIYNKMEYILKHPAVFLDDSKDRLIFSLTPIALTIISMECRLPINILQDIASERAEQAASLLPGVTFQEIKQAGLDAWGKNEEMDCVSGYRENITQLNIGVLLAFFTSAAIVPMLLTRSLYSRYLARKSKKTESLLNYALSDLPVLFFAIAPTQLREKYGDGECSLLPFILAGSGTMLFMLRSMLDKDQPRDAAARRRRKFIRIQHKADQKIRVLLRFVVKTSKKEGKEGKEGNAFNSLPKTVVSDFILPYLAPPRLLSQAFENNKTPVQSDVGSVDAARLTS